MHTFVDTSDHIQCQIKIGNDLEYKIEEYRAGDGAILIVDDGTRTEPTITDSYNDLSGATSVFIDSRNALFNIIIRPKNPCAGDYAKQTCPNLVSRQAKLVCVGENYKNVRCECEEGTTQQGSNKYHPNCLGIPETKN